jgi:glycosyltransferase involved in cell wall biosynthesis
MKVLMVNKFLFRNGGSEACMLDTARWLEERGHRVVFLGMADPRNLVLEDPVHVVSHVDFEGASSLLTRTRAAGRVLWSAEARRLVRRVIDEEAPDVAHLHNIYHQISPSVLGPLRESGTPVVMTLHDYKLVCPVYTLYRAGHPCEACAGGRYHRCTLHRCCKGSVAKSALSSVEMFLHHSLLKAYSDIACFVSPSRFLAAKVADMGFRGDVGYLPNAVDTTALPQPPATLGEGILFFGRLTEEKGVATLLEAVSKLSVPCTIVGDGPAGTSLRALAAARGLSHVRFLGQLPFTDALDEVGRAAIVAVPSRWYENAPRSVLEAFALAKPVVASRIGGLPELVRDGETGLTFVPGSSEDLRRAMLELLNNPVRGRDMGRAGRRLVEETYGKEAYMDGLLGLYAKVMAGR